MANWISSKLKVAETLLQQIDQQAAESLGKNEKPRSDDQIFDAPAKTGGVVPLKDQLKKKTRDNNDYHGKLQSGPSVKTFNNSNSNTVVFSNRYQPKETTNSSKALPKPMSTLTDSDWTELLSPPNQATSSLGSRRSNGGSTIRPLKKDGRRQGSAGSNLSLDGSKRNQKTRSNVAKSTWRSDVLLGNNFNGKPSDGEESSSSGRCSSVEMQTDGNNLDGQELKHQDTSKYSLVKPKCKGNEEGGKNFHFKVNSMEDFTQSVNMSLPLQKVSGLGKQEGQSAVKIGEVSAHDLLRSVRGKQESEAASQTSISDNLKKGSPSTSDEGSDTDSDSGSSSHSESEHEREERRRRREKILAEKMAAKAVDAIKDRENMVARLEGEKQSLEKILEERAKQQAQEASELQTTMMETLEAVEVEKQKHNNTRMEVLARLAKLETANADLARSLAATQKKLEVEINQVAELKEQMELKEVAHGELQRKISKISETHQTGTYITQLAASKGVGFECEILEAEYSFITDKIGRLQDKAKKLEGSIEMVRKEMEDPTEVEVELNRRLDQLTDHLIQKQAQVEALSAEKATLLFRIETVSRFLDENQLTDSLSRDLESGEWELSKSKLRPMFEDKIRSGRKHLGSLVQQLDAIFLSGAVFLRRNPTAKLWSLVYIVCLHFWVLYILFSHSPTSNEAKSGAVISLQNINNSSGV